MSTCSIKVVDSSHVSLTVLVDECNHLDVYTKCSFKAETCYFKLKNRNVTAVNRPCRAAFLPSDGGWITCLNLLTVLARLCWHTIRERRQTTEEVVLLSHLSHLVNCLFVRKNGNNNMGQMFCMKFLGFFFFFKAKANL